MKKSRNIFLIASLLVLIFNSQALAQDRLKNLEIIQKQRDTKTFNLLSLDGKNEIVKMVPDYANQILTITCKQNKISLSEFWGVPPKLKLLDKSFLEVEYEVRGGSGTGLGNILIVCVKDGKLFSALHVLRYCNSESGGLKTDYRVDFSMNDNPVDIYKLTALVHESLRFKQNPDMNYIYNNRTVLNFDTKRNAFYCIKENLSNCFLTNTTNTVKRKISGNFPMVILGSATYYFVDHQWYQPGNLSELTKF